MVYTDVMEAPEVPAVVTGQELTVVVPTFNEAENVALVIDALHNALDGKLSWEVVFVDDNSPDGTAEIVKRAALEDPHVRCIHRLGRRGLSTACVEGVLSSSAPFVAVMDADLQHDETILPTMLQTAQRENLDVVVGSRYVSGGGVGNWDANRQRMSKLATLMASIVTKVKLSDPMSGFFLINRATFNRLAPDLSAIGFKILLDLFATSKTPLRFAETPYQFRSRQHGESKLDNQAAWDFFMLLADKTVGKYVPVRFISFAAIGGTGIAVHLMVFSLLYYYAAQSFNIAKIAAVVLSITWNYALNNLITYRDKRYRGWRWFTGLLSFMVVCSVGAVADVGVSSYLNSELERGAVLFTYAAVIAGILVGAVWNYAVSSVYTWRSKAK